MQRGNDLLSVLFGDMNCLVAVQMRKQTDRLYLMLLNCQVLRQLQLSLLMSTASSTSSSSATASQVIPASRLMARDHAVAFVWYVAH